MHDMKLRIFKLKIGFEGHGVGLDTSDGIGIDNISIGHSEDINSSSSDRDGLATSASPE